MMKQFYLIGTVLQPTVFAKVKSFKIFTSRHQFLCTCTNYQIGLMILQPFQSDYVVGAFDVEKPWTLAEETMLLDAVEQYGFGNWYGFNNKIKS